MKRSSSGGGPRASIAWVHSARLVLAFCLIYYHNHRLFDNYRHNMEIHAFPQEELTIKDSYDLIRALQRLVLQAGLNLFCALAGTSAFLSLRSRPSSVHVVRERTIKLLVAFVFGVLTVAAPSNIVVKACGEHLPLSRFFSRVLSLEHLLAPGHLAFLPYLFIIAISLLPLLQFIVTAHQTASREWSKSSSSTSTSTGTSTSSSTLSSTANVGSYLSRANVLACTAYTVSLILMTFGWNSIVVLSLGVFVLWCFGRQSDASRRPTPVAPSSSITSTAALPLAPIKAAYHQALQLVARQWIACIRHARVCTRDLSNFTIGYTAAWPWVVGLLLNTAMVDYQFSAPALLSIFGLPCVLVMLPTRYRFRSSIDHAHAADTLSLDDGTAGTTSNSNNNSDGDSAEDAPSEVAWPVPLLERLLPCDALNIPLIAISCVVLGHLLFIGSPYNIPVFESDYDAESKLNIAQYVLQGAVPRRKLFGFLVMYVSHSSFYLMGFLWIMLERRVPSLPTANAFGITMCILCMLLPPLLLPTSSKGFFYLTAGFVSYHAQSRVWYHLGGWFWVWLCIMLCRRFANQPYDLGNSLVPRFVRMCRDVTFGTFLCHPLWGYIVGCYLQPKRWSWGYKVLVLNVAVYVLSTLWTLALVRNPLVAALFGVSTRRAASAQAAAVIASTTNTTATVASMMKQSTNNGSSNSSSSSHSFDSVSDV